MPGSPGWPAQAGEMCAATTEEGTPERRNPHPTATRSEPSGTWNHSEECHANETRGVSPDRHRRRCSPQHADRAAQPARRRLRPVRPAPASRLRPARPPRRSLRPACAGTAAWAPARTRSRSRSRRRSPRTSARSHPDSSLTFEVVTYDAGSQHAVDPDRGGHRSRHRRPGGRRRHRGLPWPVARPGAASSSRDRLRPEPVRPAGRSSSTTPTTARSGCRSQSTRRCSGTRRDCSMRPASITPPHEYGDKYTMPDGTEVEWTYETLKRDRQDPDRRRERQRRDAARTSIRRASSSRASSRSATTCADSAPTRAPATSPRPTAQTARSPTPGQAPGRTSTTACGPTTSS